jgi:hypothetical protein
MRQRRPDRRDVALDANKASSCQPSCLREKSLLAAKITICWFNNFQKLFRGKVNYRSVLRKIPVLPRRKDGIVDINMSKRFREGAGYFIVLE